MIHTHNHPLYYQSLQTVYQLSYCYHIEQMVKPKRYLAFSYDVISFINTFNEKKYFLMTVVVKYRIS